MIYGGRDQLIDEIIHVFHNASLTGVFARRRKPFWLKEHLDKEDYKYEYNSNHADEKFELIRAAFAVMVKLNDESSK